MKHAEWERGLGSEIDFWQAWVRSAGSQWPDEYAKRLDPALPLQGGLVNCLDPGQHRVEILDVGAGPLTWVGKVWDGHDVVIAAVDPLANEYRGMLQRQGVTPLVETRLGFVEALDFPTNHFDLVFMQNALDHSADPLKGIREMLRVVKPGRSVVLSHSTNEATRAGFTGLHQWNLAATDAHWTLTDKSGQLVIVNNAVRETAEVMIVDASANWHAVRLVKRG